MIIQDFVEYYHKCPLLIRLVWDLSAIISIIIFLTMVFLKFYRNKIRIIEKIEKRYQDRFEQDLIEYLFAGSENGETLSPEQIRIINNFKTIIKSPFKREILLKTLLKLKTEITGDLAESIDRFYIQTKLLNYSFNNIRSKDWYLNAKGIRELYLFNVKKAHKPLLERINHPKMEVRKEIQLYLVNLFQFEGLEFLDTLETPLSEWDQIQLLEILGKINAHESFELKPWLRSTNDSVVTFALNLAKIYNRFEIDDELIQLLDHPNEKVRVQVINLLSHFHVVDSKKILKDSFSNRTENEQNSIFKLLENIFDLEDEDFVMEHINHTNFDTKVSARMMLRDINLDKYKLSLPRTNIINPLVDCSL